MPVHKYRRVEDMPDAALQHDAGDPAIPRKIRYLWELSEAFLSPVGTCIPRGVRKFRSIEEMQADRQKYEQDRIERLRAERQPK